MRFRQTAWKSGFTRMALAAAVGCVSLSGCKSFLDQSEVTRGGVSQRLVVPILKSIDPIDEGDPEFEGASDVRAEDLKIIPTDYVIGPNDQITVFIYDLAMGGVETVRTARVSGTGMLSLPMLGEPVNASGLTEHELQEAIVERYRQAELLQDAKVSVRVEEARNRTFSIMGAVARPGQYPIFDTEFRILNALVQAGDTASPAEYIYVVRKLSSEKPAAQRTDEAADEAAPTNQQAPDVDPLAPRGEAPSPQPVMAGEQPQPAAEAPPTTEPAAPPRPQPIGTVDEGKRVLGDDVLAPDAGDAQPVQPTGQFVAETQPAGDLSSAETVTQPAYEFGATLGADEDQRVIRVPLQQLRNGSLRYNIVVRPSDVIIVPQPTPGFYYMGGHVAVPGAYNLTGQKINLKQAVSAARMLDSLAVPSRTDVIRRIGDQEIFVRVDLAKIFAGKQPDLYLKPDDVVVVGTDWYPPFLQAIRGAFRVTYGFGFLYDRNYAPERDRQ